MIILHGCARKLFSRKASFKTMKTHTGPSGFDTGITVYNSLARRKVRFLSNRSKIVSWYCCGPTVYDTAHIGNLRSYMHFDIIRRIMKNYFDLNVIMVMNITDIDDKIIARSNELQVNYKDLTEAYEREFFSNLTCLNIEAPTIVARVTDCIPDIVDFISSLVENGYGYVASDGSVYFSIKKFPNYGKFQNLQADVPAAQFKESIQDFALWKTAKDGEPFWESPWGRGRPGWHIECSAIACKFLGNSIDLHSGGIDLQFPHHENEEAQCCARFGSSQWVNHWIHSGHLYTKEEKMSKSLKNTTSVKDFLLSHTANTLRIFCLMIPYRNSVEFRSETIEKAAAIDRKFSQFLSELESYIRGEGETRGNIDESLLYKVLEETETITIKSISDDFDTNRVVTELLHLISATNGMMQGPSYMKTSGSPSCLGAVGNTIKKTLSKLGYSFNEKESIAKYTMDDVLTPAINFRSKVRQIALKIQKNDADGKQELLVARKELLTACDGFRDVLFKAGVELKVPKAGFTLVNLWCLLYVSTSVEACIDQCEPARSTMEDLDRLGK